MPRRQPNHVPGKTEGRVTPQPDKPSRLAFRSLKQHLVIGSTCQRAIEGRVPNPCLRFSSKVKSLHARS